MDLDSKELGCIAFRSFDPYSTHLIRGKLMTKRKHIKHWRPIIIISVIALILVGAIIALPYYVRKLINTELAEIDPYYGHIDDVDVWLITGAYTLDNLVIVKKDAGGKVEPFIEIPKSWLSIEWKSLLRGRIAGKVRLTEPEFNFVFAENYTQTGKETNWVDLVKDLMPIEINRFSIENGQVSTTYTGKGQRLEAEFNHLELEIMNIRNIVDKNDPLPSHIYATATSPLYKGNFVFTADANLLKKFPDMDYDAQFEQVELVTLNPLLKHETGMDFESGTLDLYSEMLIKDGTLDGYVKPVLTNVTIFKPKEEKRGIVNAIKELIAEGAQEVLENKKYNSTATNMPVQGSVKDVESEFWPILINMIRHAYWDAITKRIDHTISFKS
jgi:hypothetical protein